MLSLQSPDPCPPKSPVLNQVDYRIWGLMQKRAYVVQDTSPRHQRLEVEAAPGQVHHKTSSTKQLVNGESSDVQSNHKSKKTSL